MDGTSRTAAIHEALRDAHARLGARAAAILDDQVSLAGIAAPTGAEQRRAAWVADRFRALALRDVHSDAAGNVIATRVGAADVEPVVVCAHLDTVFPAETPLVAVRDGARVTAPGIGDNARGLVAMLAIAGELDGRRVRPQRPIIFAATVGEEGAGDLAGAKALFATLGRDVSAAIIVDGAGDERIVHHAVGSRRYRIAFSGAGGHSWASYGVPNAVHAAAGAAARLAALPLPRSPRTTLTVARIGGGLSVNAIPAQAWLEVDVRSTSATALARLQAEVARVADAAMREENQRGTPGAPPLTVDIALIGDRPSGDVPGDHPLVVAAMEATRLVGREPVPSSASTDANVPIALGIPSVAIGGGGRGGDTHTAGEWYDDTDATRGLTRALTLVASAAGLA